MWLQSALEGRGVTYPYHVRKPVTAPRLELPCRDSEVTLIVSRSANRTVTFTAAGSRATEINPDLGL